MSRWNRHSVDGASGPDHSPRLPSSGIDATSSGRMSSYGVADGVISIRSPQRAEMLPDVPWLMPSAFIRRAASTIARRRPASALSVLLRALTCSPAPTHEAPSMIPGSALVARGRGSEPNHEPQLCVSSGHRTRAPHTAVSRPELPSNRTALLLPSGHSTFRPRRCSGGKQSVPHSIEVITARLLAASEAAWVERPVERAARGDQPQAIHSEPENVSSRRRISRVNGNRVG